MNIEHVTTEGASAPAARQALADLLAGRPVVQIADLEIRYDAAAGVQRLSALVVLNEDAPPANDKSDFWRKLLWGGAK